VGELPLNKKEPVKVVPYDPEWPREFARLERTIREILGSLCLRIEHVGSTAVTGLVAKPILDIDVVISKETALEEVIAKLKTAGYIFEGDKGIPGRWAFARKDQNTPYADELRVWQDHHLYVCREDNKELKRHIFLRDYLRNHPEKAREYARLKKQSAEIFQTDRLGYSKSKDEFLEYILKQRRSQEKL